MKRYNIIICLFLLTGLNSHSQDTTKVEQYCELHVGNATTFKQITAYVNFGNGSNSFPQENISPYEAIPKTFATRIDALNFLGLHGWTLAGIDTAGNIFYFKKLFNKKGYPGCKRK